MKEISILLFLLFIAHLAGPILFNKYRIKTIRFYCKKFNQQGSLPLNDFNLLESRYTGFFGYLEGFPDDQNYFSLYSNPELLSFKKFSKRITTYLFVAIVILAVLNVLLINFS